MTDPPLTATQRAYVAAFEEWVRTGSREAKQRKDRLLDVVRNEPHRVLGNPHRVRRAA